MLQLVGSALMRNGVRVVYCEVGLPTSPVPQLAFPERPRLTPACFRSVGASQLKRPVHSFILSLPRPLPLPATQGNVSVRQRAITEFSRPDSDVRAIMISLARAASGTNLMQVDRALLSLAPD